MKEKDNGSFYALLGIMCVCLINISITQCTSLTDISNSLKEIKQEMERTWNRN